MVTLKDYIDALYTAQGLTSSISIAAPGQGAPIKRTDFQNYINKANNLPYVNGLSLPTQNTSIDASYYNTIVDALT